MSVSELKNIISPAFTEETIFKMLAIKSNFSELKILDLGIDTDKSKKGDSYLSTICRIKVRASGKDKKGELQEFTLPVIVKFFPKNIARQKTFRSAEFFKTEIEFYEKVWPDMKKFKLSKIPNEPDEIPLLLASHCDGVTDFIALEDLSYQGFKPPSRCEVVSKETLLLFLKVLADFHALGIALIEKNPEFQRKALSIPESYFTEKTRSWYENFMYKSMGPQYQKAVKQLLPQEYYDKVTKLFSGDFYGREIKGCNIQNKFSTVTQGDAWLPNFLVKSDDDRNKLDAVLIDFQLTRYSSLINDLLQFLYSCVPDQLLLKEWDDLITEYHKYLSSRIELLGGDKNFITLQELNEEIKKNAIVGIGMSLESVVISLLTENEVADLDLMEGENAIPLEEVWILPEYDRTRNERLAFVVKHMVDKGLIP